MEEFKNKTKEVVEKMKKTLSSVRTGRPATALVENIQTDYYGQKTPVKQIASIGVVPPREITIQAWDKEAVSSIIKAIESSNLGLSANPDGNIIRIHLPELSHERREELSRYIKKEAENYRIETRHFRDEANKRIQKMFDSKEINEDEKFKLKENIQKETGKINSEIDKLLENKIKEINE